MKKDTENLDILLLLKSQPLHRVAPFSVPSWEQALFCDEQTDSETIYTCPSEPSNFDTADCLIYDTLAFSFGHRQDYIVSVSNVTTGELIGKFCKRGRAWEEPMNGLPLQELYVES